MSDKLIHDERMRIWEGIQEMYNHSHNTRTPLYQDTIYENLRTLVWPSHPPKHFRDIANGE